MTKEPTKEEVPGPRFFYISKFVMEMTMDYTYR